MDVRKQLRDTAKLLTGILLLVGLSAITSPVSIITLSACIFTLVGLSIGPKGMAGKACYRVAKVRNAVIKKMARQMFRGF